MADDQKKSGSSNFDNSGQNPGQGQNDRERMQGGGGVDKSPGMSGGNSDLGQGIGGRSEDVDNIGQSDRAINRGVDENLESGDLSTPKNTDWNPQADVSRDRGQS